MGSLYNKCLLLETAFYKASEILFICLKIIERWKFHHEMVKSYQWEPWRVEYIVAYENSQNYERYGFERDFWFGWYPRWNTSDDTSDDEHLVFNIKWNAEPYRTTDWVNLLWNNRKAYTHGARV